MTAGTRALVDKLRAECDRANAQFFAAEVGPDRRRREISAQLRRRREAELRLPSLDPR